MSNTILVVDDEPRILTIIENYLKQYGFHVIRAINGEEALRLAAKYSPDLIILDIMMPKMDGYEVLQEFRKTTITPIIFLTARVEDEDKILGLELGADDYIIKPFRPRELMARVKSLLRRNTLLKNEMCRSTLCYKDLELNQENHTTKIKNTFVDLTPSEFGILAVLISKPGKVFSRLDLLDMIQGVRYDGYERTIDLHIKNLRAKLMDDPRNPKYIQTVYGAGYRMVIDG